MDTTIESKVSVKLFIGCCVTPELKNHLSQSNEWKQASIMRATDQDVLTETHFQNKLYIGLYADDLFLTMHEIHAVHKKIIEQIHLYCPKLARSDKLPVFIFPQIFVT